MIWGAVCRRVGRIGVDRDPGFFLFRARSSRTYCCVRIDDNCRSVVATCDNSACGHTDLSDFHRVFSADYPTDVPVGRLFVDYLSHICDGDAYFLGCCRRIG